MLKNKRRIGEISLILGLLSAIFLNIAHFDAACEDLRHNVLRLHIIANSDSREDQELKLLIRDEILAATPDVFKDKTDITDAEESVAVNLPVFKEIAEKVLKENGAEYSADAMLGDSYFETREYDDFTLPAGTYRSLIIKLGKAEGKNWWCVVFPAVCLPSAAPEAKLTDSTSEESANIAQNPDKFIMRFKAVEIYENFKKRFMG